MASDVEILTTVYGYVNRMKVALAFGEVGKLWYIINELSDYLVSVDVAAALPEPKDENET